MEKILRWHVSRLYEEEDSSEKESRRLTVTVTPQYKGKSIPDSAGIDGWEQLGSLQSDNLDWWDLDSENEIEGFISEQQLISALLEKNVRPLEQCVGIAWEKNEEVFNERQIKEDTVFLQIYEDEFQAEEILENFQGMKTLRDLKKILWGGPSRLLDFTQQARKMSAEQYKKV
ncbi:hypothetical protein ACFL7M_18970, partial [Thermodesulfobacteriota bacterium]